MPALTIEYRDDNERLALEQAIAYVAQLRQLALTAPDGTVLAACEQRVLADGRALLRSTLAAALDSRIEAAEQKGGGGPPLPRGAPRALQGPTPAHRPDGRRPSRRAADVVRLRDLRSRGVRRRPYPGG